ncbi:MAG: cobyrinate a,c-diamide synthase [Nitrospira sp.]|nr:cobyrinate a,c-diamide synthase [Nitrospira sp.]HBP86549.1 cobyrinate a,c-diamide synthase [Nitrospiraceae bacterium]HNP27443.1 cobyrinate a,c-diamide synthase [Nitrospirales bacterium]
MRYPRIIIAGTHSGVGKTTVTLALLAAFHAKGRTVQPFKIGPDFLDPGHHQLACGRESRNLDGWMLGAVVNRSVFQEAANGADLSIIEGMMGMFDGSSPVKLTGSTAEMAHQLHAPIVLVVDGSAMARSAAAMVYGYATFDSSLTIAGVIFNRIKSEGHYQLLKEAVEKETHIPVVGYLRPDSEVTIPDRHLGLRTALEGSETGLYTKLGQLGSETIDLARVERLAQASPDLPITNSGAPKQPFKLVTRSVKIGVAYDPAFCFYYRDNLTLLKDSGGELVRFSPINDPSLPDVDLVYLGGGYPEIYAEALQRNRSMRQSIQAFFARGGVIYAECGGLMYLAKTLRDFDGTVYDMVGVIPAETAMSRTKMTLGYRELTLTRRGPLGEQGVRIRGHEFHYSTLQPKGDLDYLGHLTDAQGRDRGGDGITVGNVIALYTHLHFSSHPHVPLALVEAARVEPATRGNRL